MSIHFPELDNLKKPPILAFSNLVICLDCGFVESTISDSELKQLVDGTRDMKGGG